MLAAAPFQLEILPSAMMDVVRTQYFYDSLERGLGSVLKYGSEAGVYPKERV